MRTGLTGLRCETIAAFADGPALHAHIAVAPGLESTSRVRTGFAERGDGFTVRLPGAGPEQVFRRRSEAAHRRTGARHAAELLASETVIALEVVLASFALLLDAKAGPGIVERHAARVRAAFGVVRTIAKLRNVCLAKEIGGAVSAGLTRLGIGGITGLPDRASRDARRTQIQARHAHRLIRARCALAHHFFARDRLALPAARLHTAPSSIVPTCASPARPRSDHPTNKQPRSCTRAELPRSHTDPSPRFPCHGSRSSPPGSSLSGFHLVNTRTGSYQCRRGAGAPTSSRRKPMRHVG